MPDTLNLSRRQWLLFAASAAAASQAPALAAGVPVAPRLVTAWEAGHGYQVGILAPRGDHLDVLSALDVPTRAHGVWVEKNGGTLLAVARRPGDWLLRWKPGDGKSAKAVQWSWTDTDRAFNGHVIASADGKTLYTTETDLETGQGLVGIRDAATLEKTGEWPTHGMDPHELLLDDDGTLVVANGGIPALPETGRTKIHLDRMDASLVRLDPKAGRLLGQWRLADQRLSMRHIAWGPVSAATGHRLLGIALQGEHDDPAAKAAAAVLAVFDGASLQVHAAPDGQALSGYGGDIAWAADSFAVSCPKAHGVARWRADGQWLGFSGLAEACALTAVASAPSNAAVPVLWAGGRFAVLADDGHGHLTSSPITGIRLDNHWTPLAA